VEPGAEHVIYRSPLPAVAVPAITVPAHVLARSDGKLALRDAVTSESLTYAELNTLVERTAKGLVAQGVEPGDVIAVTSPNRPMYAVGLHAIMVR